MSSTANEKIFIGPFVHTNERGELITVDHAAIYVKNGKINNIIVNPKSIDTNDKNVTVLSDSQFLIPGFIDCHIHAAQLPNVGIGYEKKLLEWLETYTFPLEKKYANADFAQRVFDIVVKYTIMHGTTTACYFASLYSEASVVLGEKASSLGQRALIGKITMNATRNDGYYETTEDSIKNMIKFVEDIIKINSPLIKPVITPRFALSCDMAVMKELGKLAKEKELHIQIAKPVEQNFTDSAITTFVARLAAKLKQILLPILQVSFARSVRFLGQICIPIWTLQTLFPNWHPIAETDDYGFGKGLFEFGANLSHISENLDEIQAVKSIFPKYTSYAAVYDAANLLTSKTVMAHGIHLTDNEIALLKERGTAVIHCPSSNTCLKSGLCDVQKLKTQGLKVALGTDVAGGQSCSILDSMRSALQVSIHLSLLKENYEPLNYKDVFHMATLGGATALAMDKEIGNFVIGKEFDALIIDANAIIDSLNVKDYSLEERLQKFIYSGDDRNIVEVYISGRKVK